MSYPKADEIGDGRHVVDWIQYGWLQCCGLTDPRDWNINSHFNCSSRSSEAGLATNSIFFCFLFVTTH